MVKRLKLLGKDSWIEGKEGEKIQLRYLQKNEAVLFYLAAKGVYCDRNEVANMLWSTKDPRSNLRTALDTIRLKYPSIDEELLREGIDSLNLKASSDLPF